jgi:hypothetical protein
LETKGVDMPGEEKCKGWKKMGYGSFKDCRDYKKIKQSLYPTSESIKEMKKGKVKSKYTRYKGK